MGELAVVGGVDQVESLGLGMCHDFGAGLEANKAADESMAPRSGSLTTRNTCDGWAPPTRSEIFLCFFLWGEKKSPTETCQNGAQARANSRRG